MPVAIGNYIALSAVMFFIGVAGVMPRRNPLIMLMCDRADVQRGEPAVHGVRARVG